jgi:hypothetical protein
MEQFENALRQSRGTESIQRAPTRKDSGTISIMNDNDQLEQYDAESINYLLHYVRDYLLNSLNRLANKSRLSIDAHDDIKDLYEQLPQGQFIIELIKIMRDPSKVGKDRTQGYTYAAPPSRRGNGATREEEKKNFQLMEEQRIAKNKAWERAIERKADPTNSAAQRKFEQEHDQLAKASDLMLQVFEKFIKDHDKK